VRQARNERTFGFACIAEFSNRVRREPEGGYPSILRLWRLWVEVRRSRTAQLDEAKRTHDVRKIQELEAWGKSQQDLAHKHLSGEAPLTSVEAGAAACLG
jgi:hypothetical protein